MTNPELSRRNFLQKTAVASAASLFGFPNILKAADTKLKMVLNWRYEGPQAWYFLAQDRGYFAKAGIDIQIDQGNGSGAAVGKVAGIYDVGFGDVNALIQLAAQKPEEAPVCVYQLYNTPPFTIAVLKDGPIKTAKDLAGRTLGGAPNDGALKLFSIFSKGAGIDTSNIDIVHFQPNMREQMLRTKQVDGVFGYVNTIRFSAKLSGMDPDNDLRFINFSDYGIDLYSNGIIVNRELAVDKPEIVRGLVHGINRGISDVIADPNAGIAAVAKREGLINRRVEKERLLATLEFEMNHPEIATHGLGAIDEERFSGAIDTVVEAYGLPRTPSIEEIYTPEFLPPESDRLYKLL
ncbi:ABC transporter substrate-binding protein [Pelagicoccus albus]|uniref:Thiamine pyrimidine synthase n=1 Tax=Pelagicoccus albus TaxID=415222 RepID=A0A7X1B912_9BACT|nr:ABC transporter substrate-binding protein [Pelagicoccus albus]MBC2607934.1 ABC transporter substrate-binding protein [Pelagicoccus albus]